MKFEVKSFLLDLFLVGLLYGIEKTSAMQNPAVYVLRGGTGVLLYLALRRNVREISRANALLNAIFPTLLFGVLQPSLRFEALLWKFWAFTTVLTYLRSGSTDASEGLFLQSWRQLFAKKA